jgi:uncharacterized protein YceH (UPF0502 family)
VENYWNDDDSSWWYQQDLEMQERDEEQRIEACNKALAELKERLDESV